MSEERIEEAIQYAAEFYAIPKEDVVELFMDEVHAAADLIAKGVI